MPRRLERQTRRPGKGIAAAFCLVAALLAGYVGVAALTGGATATGLIALAVAVLLAAGAAALARARRAGP